MQDDLLNIMLFCNVKYEHTKIQYSVNTESYLQVPVGQVVMLQFRLFDLEADPTCRYDYVDVYNGHSYTVQKLGRFCGTFRPGALMSTSNLMMLEMVSDSGRGGRGFLAFFSGGKPHVDGWKLLLAV